MELATVPSETRRLDRKRGIAIGRLTAGLLKEPHRPLKLRPAGGSAPSFSVIRHRPTFSRRPPGEVQSRFAKAQSSELSRRVGQMGTWRSSFRAPLPYEEHSDRPHASFSAHAHADPHNAAVLRKSRMIS